MSWIIRRSVLPMVLVGTLVVSAAGSVGAGSSDPYMVLDIKPGPAGSGIGPRNTEGTGGHMARPTEFEGKLFFAAGDGIHGNELWVSDGTARGTVLLKDINPGPEHSDLRWFMEVGENLFFLADDGIHGYELWVTDGTAAGTVLLGDINPGLESSLPLFSTGVGGPVAEFDYRRGFQDRLFFMADDGVHGWELWVSDGTAEGTVLVKDINPGPDGSSTKHFTVFDGRLFFDARDGVHGSELWVSDGTAEGTVLVKDINLGPDDSSPRSSRDRFTAVGENLLFRADDGTHGFDWWVSDGTAAGTALVEPGPDGSPSGASLVAVFHEQLFFADFGPRIDGWELRVSDGAAEWTGLSEDINLGPDRLTRTGWVVFGGRLFFTFDDGIHGRELWVSDGTAAGTVLFKDLQAGPVGARPGQFTFAGGKLFFTAFDHPLGVGAQELWVTDGTAVGTTQIKAIGAGGRYPAISRLKAFEGKLYFSIQLEKRRSEFWVSDGTAAGTVRVPGIQNGPLDPLTEFDGSLAFGADDGIHGPELWVLLGDTEATPDLAMFNPENGRWRLRHSDADIDRFNYGLPGDTPLMGDWNCDGTDTVAVYRGTTGVVYYRNSNDTGVGDGSFFFGKPGDIPMAGDWDGDGCDSIGVYRNGRVLLRNTLDTGPATTEYWFGAPGDRPFAGDFDGDGIDTIGVHRPSTGLAYIGKSHTTGGADLEFVYGVSTDHILAGDWDSDGDDTVGTYRPSDHTFRLSFNNQAGVADMAIRWGHGPWIPVGGSDTTR